MNTCDIQENQRVFIKDKALRDRARPFEPSWAFKRGSTEKAFYIVLGDAVTLITSAVLAFYVSEIFKALFFPEIPAIAAGRAQQVFPIMFGLPMLILMGVNARNGHYSRFKPFWDEYGELIRNVFLVASITTLIFFFDRTHFSRGWFVFTWLFVLGLVPLVRLAAKHWLMRRGKWFTPTVIVGTGPTALKSARAIESNILMGFRVVSLLDISGGDQPAESVRIKDLLSDREFVYPVLSLSDENLKRLDSYGGTYLVIALESDQYIDREEVLTTLTASHHHMSVIPPLKGVPMLGGEISPIFRHEVLHLTIKNNLARRGSRLTKRVFDLLLSSILLLLFSPLFLYVGLKVKKDGGPAFFSQKRIGYNGKIFNCMKFRSMHVNAEQKLQEILESNPALKAQWEEEQKLTDDPRITSVGKWIRKTSVDELPQLINVLKGDMSFVGPRPVRADELSKYGANAANYLKTPPGITGLWQISGRNDVSYDTRVYLDTWYVRNWSLWLDITILAKTVKIVFRGHGAY